LPRREDAPFLGRFCFFFEEDTDFVFDFDVFFFTDPTFVTVRFFEEEARAALRGLRLAPAPLSRLLVVDVPFSPSSITNVMFGKEEETGDGAGSLTPELNVSPRRRSALI
jgi:hypothetical protein